MASYSDKEPLTAAMETEYADNNQSLESPHRLYTEETQKQTQLHSEIFQGQTQHTHQTQVQNHQVERLQHQAESSAKEERKPEISQIQAQAISEDTRHDVKDTWCDVRTEETTEDLTPLCDPDVREHHDVSEGDDTDDVITSDGGMRETKKSNSWWTKKRPREVSLVSVVSVACS